jgi:uncharacterized surface protein with fasciclin (FAS1) repeats
MRINTKKHDSGWLWPLIGLLAIILIWWWASGNNSGAPAPEKATTAQSTTTSSGGKKSTTTAKATSSTVVGVAEGLSQASTFASWLESTDVASELSADGTYTLFAPTNDVIAALPAGTFRNLSVADQKRFVEYHIIVGKVIDANAQIAGTVQTMSLDPINFTRRAGQSALVGSGAIVAEYKATNGVVYLVNDALIPPQKSI